MPSSQLLIINRIYQVIKEDDGKIINLVNIGTNFLNIGTNFLNIVINLVNIVTNLVKIVTNFCLNIVYNFFKYCY